MFYFATGNKTYLMLNVYKQLVSYIKGSGLVYHGIGAGHLPPLASVCTVLFMSILYTCNCTKKKSNQ